MTLLSQQNGDLIDRIEHIEALIASIYGSLAERRQRRLANQRRSRKSAATRFRKIVEANPFQQRREC